MPTLEIISVNIWNVLISLANLLVLYWLVKKFLFKPVKRILEQRQQAVDARYADADAAKAAAEADRTLWEQKLQTADEEADALVAEAKKKGLHQEERIVADAKEKAEEILRRAKTDADLERKKAQADIKQEIVDVSALLAAKMLDREINAADHKRLIDSVLDTMGDGE